MIRVKPRSEPTNFHGRCRKRGRRWLRAHKGYVGRPRDYWSEFEPQLRRVFKGLCGYCAMVVYKGQVDHYVPIAALKKKKKDTVAYDWTNLRYVDASMNQRKSTRVILDPYEVAEGWFEVLLPSLQLVLTSRVPQSSRGLAEFTLKKMGLGDGEQLIRYRREWFLRYKEGKLSLAGLTEVAPLIAQAVEKKAMEYVEAHPRATARGLARECRICDSQAQLLLDRLRAPQKRKSTAK